MQLLSRVLLIGLLEFGLLGLLFGQTPTPFQQGGSPTRAWNMRQNAVFYRYDFVKFHPDYTPVNPDAQRICSTVEVEEQRKQFFAKNENQVFENWLDKQIRGDMGYVAKKTAFKIPVIVHVIYSNPLENISDEQIHSQIRSLNADYQRLNADTTQTNPKFQDITADIGIEFVLATRSPQNEPTNGIERISMSGAPFSEDFLNHIIKPNTIWDPQRYLNFWVCNLGDKVLGFSQFPESSGLTGLPDDVGSENTDGVVIHYAAFGTEGVLTSPFHKGRTATHEVGHWLGLRHIWGDGGCEVDDFCEDTPRTGSPNSGCNPNKMGCEATAMIENFMDYTHDSCMNSFTIDQRTRIFAVMNHSPRRKSLPFSNALTPLEYVPRATFTADIKIGIAPLEVKFKDLTQGDYKDRQWIFPGATPPKSYEKNPTILYQKAGDYTVGLKLSNEKGEDNRPATHYIHVFEKGNALPYQLDFEQDLANLEKNRLCFVQETRHHTWQHFVGTGGRGTSAGAIVARNYSQNKIGARAVFFLPVLDFTTGIEAQLQFDLAYRHYNAHYGDTLAVYISTNGGKNFEAIYYKYGAQLSRNRSDENVFQPLPADWVTEKIDLRAYDKFDKIMLAFVCYSGNGNHLFLDNIQVNSAPLPLPEIDFQVNKREACVGEDIQFTDKTRFRPQEWLWAFPGAETTADTARNPKIRYREAGVYEVLLTARNSTGENSGIKKAYITIKPTPQLTLIGDLQPVCPQTLVVLKAMGATQYKWEYEGKTLNNDSFQDTLHQSTTVLLTGKIANGCTTTQALNLQVKDEQAAKVVPYAANICVGESLQLTAMGGLTYQWTGLGIQNPTKAQQLLRPIQDGTYQVAIQTAGNCTIRKAIPVIVHPLPSLKIQTTKTSICKGDAITLVAQGAISYNWKGQENTNRNLNIHPTHSQTYELVGINEYGCSDSIAQEIQVNPLPLLAYSPTNLTLCAGNSQTIQLKGANHYQWFSQDKRESGTTSNQFTLTPFKNQNYKVIGKSEKGCTDTLTIPLTLLPAPILTLDADKYAICKGQTVTLTAKGATAYQWKSSTGKTGNQAVFTDNPTQTTTYTVSGKNANGCTSPPIEMEISTLTPTAPIADFALLNKGKICAGDALLFSATGSKAQQYEWEFPGGDPAFSTQPYPEVKYEKGGVYTVYLRVTNCEGKTDEVQKQDFVVVEELPKVDFVADKERICEGETIRLKAETVNFTQIEWKAPNLTLTGKEISFLAQTTTSFQVNAHFSNGCTRKLGYTLAVVPNSESLEVLPASPSVCEGDSIVLTVTNGNLPLWKSLSSGKITQGKSLRLLPKHNQNYELIAQNSAGCPIKKEINIAVLPKPQLQIDPPMTLLCKGSNVTLSASGGVAYQWSPEIGLSNFAGKEIIASPLMTQTYTVMGMGENGCKSTAVATVGVSEIPPLVLRADDKAICKGNATRLLAEGAEVYEWSPTVGITQNRNNHIIVQPDYTTTYQVIGTGEDGCKSRKTFTLIVHDFEPLQIFPLAPVLCSGDSVQLEVMTPYNNVRWAEGIPIRQSHQKKVWAKPTQSRRYQVQAWDENGCNRTGAVSVIVKQAEAAQIVAARSLICEGEQITLEATGGKEYQWLPAKGVVQQNGNKITVSPEKTEVYRVVTKDKEGCRDTARFDIAAKLIVPRLNVSQWDLDLANEKGIVSFKDSTIYANSWEWDFGDGTKAEGKHVKHLYTQPGNYVATLTVGNGVCKKIKTQTIHITNSSDIGELERKNNLQLSLAPDLLTLRFQLPTDMTFKVSLLDAKQEELLSGMIAGKQGENQHEIDISNFPKGNYFLKIATHNQQLVRKIEKK